ncbi:hypothetical protein TcWFU_005909 [Taenia crassiceps]|uniref:Uncharacterized protein n=1 Tax=Taenia crassiceps TaxID=6207 RepID=A0ABR4Q7A4_9CEST
MSPLQIEGWRRGRGEGVARGGARERVSGRRSGCVKGKVEGGRWKGEGEGGRENGEWRMEGEFECGGLRDMVLWSGDSSSGAVCDREVVEEEEEEEEEVEEEEAVNVRDW